MTMLRHFLSKLAASVILASLITMPSAHSAVKAGDSCKKVGVTSTANGKKYTCIKSGKKLVWNKGVTVVIATAPKTIAEALANYSQVPSWAFKKSAETISKSPSKKLLFTFLVGPNTNPIYEVPQIPTGLVSKMFPSYELTKEFVIIYYNFQDVKWAEVNFSAYIGETAGYDTSGEVKKHCQSASLCESASAVTNSVTGTTVLLITSADYKKSDRHFNSGTMEAHEFFHGYQNAQFTGNGRSNAMMPRWLVEGSASFVEMASVYSNDFTKYLGAKGSLLTQLQYQKSFREEDLIKFLDAPSLGTNWSSWDSYPQQRVYDIGMLVSEMMVAVAGPESLLEQFKLVASGLSYKQAFEKVFGVSWEEGVKLIAKAISRETS